MQTINLKRLNIQTGDTVLDLGCGEGRHTIGAHFFYPHALIYGVDISFSDLTTAKSKLTDWQSGLNQTPPASDNPEAADTDDQPNAIFCQTSGFNLPFPDKSFDHVICSEVLEHIPNFNNFFSELVRVLKPRGTLSVSVPRAWPERICWRLSDAYHEVEGGHVHIFSSKKILDLFSQHHITINCKHYAHALHAPYWWLKCLFSNRSDDFFLIRKYHDFLVWDMMNSPKSTRTLENILNPIMGKSAVFYGRKND